MAGSNTRCMLMPAELRSYPEALPVTVSSFPSFQSRQDQEVLTRSIDPSRDVGVTLTDRTSFIAGFVTTKEYQKELWLTTYRQADWSPDNLPEIQYYLWPPRDRDDFRRKPVADLIDANGQTIYEQWPKPGQAARPLKNFPVLPLQVYVP